MRAAFASSSPAAYTCLSAAGSPSSASTNTGAEIVRFAATITRASTSSRSSSDTRSPTVAWSASSRAVSIRMRAST